MLISTQVILPPSKTVKQDLFTRSGAANEFSYTPYEGLYDMVKAQFKNVDDISLDDLIANIVDLRLDKLRPHSGDNPDDEERSMSDDYDVMFEDIGQEWIDKYGTMMLVGYKLNQKNSYREYSKDNLELVRAFVDDETGECVTEGDLVSKRNMVTSEYIKAKNKIPHLLKMLFSGSKLYGIHLLSCLIAYSRAKQQVNNGTVTSRAFRRMGIYKVDTNGKISRMIRDDEDSSARYQTIWHWISGEYPDDIYYRSGMDLLSCLICCNVDITQENPLSYDLEFFQKLNVSYVPSNDEFIELYSGSLGTKFTNMIERDGIDMILRNVVDTHEEESDTLIGVKPAVLAQKCVDLIADNTSCIDMINPEVWGISKDSLLSIDDFLMTYIPFIGKYLNQNYPEYRLRNFIFKKGYMVNRKTGLYFTVCINPLLDYFTSELVLGCVSKSGNIVVINNISSKLKYIRCSDVCEFVRKGDDVYKEWSEIYI